MKSTKIFWTAFFPLMILGIAISVINLRSDAVHGFYSIFMHGLHLVIVIAQVILVVFLIRAMRKEMKEKEKDANE